MNNKYSFWNNSLIYAFGFLFIRAISFLLLPFHTKFLNPEVLGYVFLLITFLAFLNTIFNHGMDSAMLKYFHDENYKEVVSTSVLYSLLVGVLFTIVLACCNLVVAQSFISKLSPLFFSLCLSAILFFDMLSTRLLNVLRMTRRPYYFLFVCLINVFTALLLNIILIKNLGLGFDGAFLSIFGTSLLQLLFLSPVVYSNVRLHLFKKSILLKMLKFGMPVFPSAIFLVAIELSDRWMLKWFDSIESVGLYGAGYKIATLILIIVKSFNLNWQPYYLNRRHQNDYKNYGLIGSSFVLILIFLCTTMSATYPHFIKINFFGYSLLDAAFWQGAIIIPIIAFAYLFFGVFILQMPSIYLKNKQNWLPVFWGFGFIINLIGNMCLIPKLSFVGAAIATLLAYFCMSIFIIYKNTAWMPVHYSLKPILVLSSVSIMLLLLLSGSLMNQSINIVFIFSYIVWALLFIKNKFLFPR